MKTFTVYTRRIAYELRKEGFKILEVKINKTNPFYNVWVFEDTPDFKQAFLRLAEQSK